jgi:hypothetical protein
MGFGGIGCIWTELLSDYFGLASLPKWISSHANIILVISYASFQQQLFAELCRTKAATPAYWIFSPIETL